MGKHIRTGNAKVIVIKYKSTCVETQLSVFEQWQLWKKAVSKHGLWRVLILSLKECHTF